MKRCGWILGGAVGVVLGTTWGCVADGEAQSIRTISQAFVVDDFEVTSLNVWEVDSKCAPGFQPIVQSTWREDVIRSSASFGSTPQDSTCSLGGDASRNWGATGYYWVRCPSGIGIPTQNASCYFVDPHGHPFYAMGPTRVRPYNDISDPEEAATWARDQTEMLRGSFGANIAGAWSWDELRSNTALNFEEDPQASLQPLARTPLLNFLGGLKNRDEDGMARLRKIAALTICEDKVDNVTRDPTPDGDGKADRYTAMPVYGYYFLDEEGELKYKKGCLDIYWGKLELALVYGGEQTAFSDHVAEVASDVFGNQDDGFKPIVTDPNVLGYFLDNEITYSNDLLDVLYWLRGSELHYLFEIADEFLDSQIGDPEIRAAVDYDLGQTYDVASGVWLHHEHHETHPKTTHVRARFTEEVLKDYFRVTTEAVRNAAPNHLILGARYANHEAILPELTDEEHTGIWQDRRHIFRAAGEFVDVISVNFYRDWYPTTEDMNTWYEHGGKPFMISENYVRARYKEDDPVNQMANCSKNGAAWLVNKQWQRGDYYQNFALHVLRHRGSVGLMIFRYMDLALDNSEETPMSPWGHVDNKGIVDFSDAPYEQVANRIEEINSRVYGLRPSIPLIFDELCASAPHLEHCGN